MGTGKSKLHMMGNDAALKLDGLNGLILVYISDGMQRPTQGGIFTSAPMKQVALGHTGMEVLGLVPGMGWK